MNTQDSLAEWSKAPDSSSGGAIRVGSNPTAVILPLHVLMLARNRFAFPPEVKEITRGGDCHRYVAEA